ncbi:MAG: hypothetical protein WD066_13070 [Planctomycetaceae bacterium]
MKKLLIVAVAAAGMFFVFGGKNAEASHYHAPAYGCAPAYGFYRPAPIQFQPIYSQPYFYTQPRYYGGSRFGGWNNYGRGHGHHGHRHNNFRGGRGINIRF